jgi:hypothetical protein
MNFSGFERESDPKPMTLDGLLEHPYPRRHHHVSGECAVDKGEEFMRKLAYLPLASAKNVVLELHRYFKQVSELGYDRGRHRTYKARIEAYMGCPTRADQPNGLTTSQVKNAVMAFLSDGCD